MSELDPVQRFVLRGSRARHLDLTFVRGDDALALASFIFQLRPSVTFAASDETASTTVGVSAEGLRLLGISERAQMLGGRCDAGERGGRFVVDVWLPWH